MRAWIHGSVCRAATAWLAATVLGGCGGGSSGTDASGGSGGSTAPMVATLQDPTAYSSAPAAALPGAIEAVATTNHSIVLGTATIAYTATTGHVNAVSATTGAAEASMFYAAYTVPAGAAAARPLVFFFNGGPGSASVWLHLGSFAPRRIVTNDPSLAIPLPYQLVDNGESLIDVADLVFVDAVGTGYSEAIAPFTNQSFWSVDSDAALMRDFIARYVAVNQRAASPTFIFGESYGTTRAAVLAELMLAAGMRLDGVALQSSILDYNSSCDVFAPGAVSCAGSLPSYGMVGAWFRLTRPPQQDLDAYAVQLRAFAAATYAPAVAAFIETRQAPASVLVDQLVDLTGAAASLWNVDLDLDALTFRSNLLKGQLIGRYDARVAAPAGSPLAGGGDPSSTLITAPFAGAALHLFTAELGYSAVTPYTLLSNAIDTWDFRHDGRGLPDAVPDLAAAIARRPTLRVLSLAGYHDLATPFHQTELDLARIEARAGVFTRVYAGGHMTYLDDASRLRLKADLAAFVTGAPLQAAAPSMTRVQALEFDAARPAHIEVSHISTPLLDRGALAQGGDPYVPPPLRIRPGASSPSGAALRALVERKIADHDATR